MNLMYIIAGAIAIVLLIYLFFALLNPERFG
jgi:K+-transporting ATPase KdpF subunit